MKLLKLIYTIHIYIYSNISNILHYIHTYIYSYIVSIYLLSIISCKYHDSEDPNADTDPSKWVQLFKGNKIYEGHRKLKDEFRDLKWNRLNILIKENSE